MLTISVAPQINSSVENIAATINSGSSEVNKSEGEKFRKVLQREVSEAANKHERNSTPAAKQRSDSTISEEENDNDTNSTATATAADNASSTNHFVQNLLIDSANLLNADQSQLPTQSILDPNTTIAIPNMPQVSTAILSNSLIPQDDKQASGLMILTANQIMQQKIAQQNLITNDYFSLPNNIWQSLNLADSAVNGNLLSFSSETMEATRSAAGESIFSAHNESPASQSFNVSSLNNTGTQITAPQDIHVELPINQPKWGSEFAQKVVWLTSQQNQVAEIHLNPAHLGPVDVMLTITQDQATAQFVSPHLAVREAIEEALPRLREIMAENGIQLGNVMVGADSFQRENKQQQAYQSTKNATSLLGAESETTNQINTVTMSGRHHGMVNTYA
ncbi:flagellar hook-length control protein FliK [Nitrosomonas supralitoralis]|uniref:Flagellar hook-length control protein-like C-terminal domain-containing protein n=1 Tax=Nitrosomonas supralitoralis TaxID=2116706 RepID=A0A2P7NYW1_9PROT|nr:flagellar hook-length control protein FliK [Nitrosomonas supralitoralis]PSJ18663.1 hypothetical protein C7H79_01180 [Nitrosomonas supralitoralis]